MLGSPIAHSLSPALHRAAYTHLGLSDWDYGRHEVVADELASFVADCDVRWRGLSLTMPLKEAALELGEVDDIARLAGAGNTLIFADDGSRQIHNTDVGGLVDALGAAGVTAPERAVILGAGATARSTLVSLARLGAREIVVVARNPVKAGPLVPLADVLGVRLVLRSWDEPAPSTDLLVSTVTAGAADPRADELAAASAAVFDVVYHPWPTPLAHAAALAERVLLNGLDLLVHQAVRQVELMTGRSVPAAVLYEAGHTALD
ncbi:MAG: shikimate dehydrogenase [Microlunatus sp.]|nr:shikimate dehydrogenase [Microlunatus sp.]MDN5770744.1 shikimate dehydrogenase [Microlunatus sp.]MDN5804616.1 shikimate dehydrogenase [Microlunatus sp.]